MFLAVALPKMPSDNDVSFKSLPTLLKSPALRCIYVLTIVAITGHYTAYSYIEPFLGQIAGLSDGWITMVLSAFGVVGIIGSWFFSRYYDRHNLAFIRFAGHLHIRAPASSCSVQSGLHNHRLHPLGTRHKQLQSCVPIRNHPDCASRHSYRNVHLLRHIQCRHRCRSPRRRNSLRQCRRSFSGLCRRYNRRRRRVLLPNEIHPGIDNALERLECRKLSNLLKVSANLRAVTRSKAVSPTHVYHVTLTLNPSPRGRDLPSPSRALQAVFRTCETCVRMTKD